MRCQVISLWRNDADRCLEARARHLLAKRSSGDVAGELELSWLWIVGDSTDGTAELLEEAAGGGAGLGLEVEIINGDTGIAGEDLATRRRRLSATATILFAAIDPRADLVLLHESDLRSSDLVIEELLAAVFDVAEEGSSIRHAVAGWPTIELEAQPQFYDVWAYRDLDGRPFSARAPYARGYRRRQPFEVSSFGSVWLAPADLVRGRVLEELAILDLCRQWRAEGVRLWCDPRVAVVQPKQLWSPVL